MNRDFGKVVDAAQQLAPWAVLLIVTIFLLALGLYLLGKYWGRGGEDRSNRAEDLTNFREMHERGELSDEEFRTIKTQLAGQLQAKVNDSGETG